MEGKISHSGLLARSPEGHAARGMQIKGNEDVWVEIQANTFRNWVNEHLPQNLRVADLSQDLCTGVRLCALVEALRGHPLKPAWNKRPANQHHYLENVTTALSGIEQDGVKLVNIGKDVFWMKVDRMRKKGEKGRLGLADWWCTLDLVRLVVTSLINIM